MNILIITVSVSNTVMKKWTDNEGQAKLYLVPGTRLSRRLPEDQPPVDGYKKTHRRNGRESLPSKGEGHMLHLYSM